MDELCTACHCTGRKLFFISDTKFENLYSQIINEISVYNIYGMCIRICWECKALLRRMDEFKEQAKRCYLELVQLVEQNATKPFPSYPRLRIHRIDTISYPKPIKEEEQEESDGNLVIDMGGNNDDIPMNDEHPFHDDDMPLNGVDVLNGDVAFAVKSEDTHCEPETFVRNWDSEDIKTKKGSKKVKPIKEKTKKKQKIKQEKEVKRKVKKKTEHTKSPRTVGSTKESLKDSTVDSCYNQDVNEETKVEEVEKNGDRIEEGTGAEDTGENVNILLYSTPSYKMKPKKPVAVKEPLSDKPTCAECGKSFSSRKTYRYHLNVLHKGQNRHPCPRCGKVYQWKSNLGRHIRSHKARDSDELHCEKCDKRFASVATYRQHLRISRRHVSESDFSYTCNECGKKFVNKTRLRDHVDWEHLKKIKFTCQKCNKAFKCHTSLYVHLQNVHGAKEHKLNLCHVCGKSYQIKHQPKKSKKPKKSEVVKSEVLKSEVTPPLVSMSVMPPSLVTIIPPPLVPIMPHQPRPS